jgi:hypothetical protein
MGKRKITQVDRVLRHLNDNRGITTWEAIKEYGITRLSAKIFDLRKMGYDIENEWVYARNRYGEPVRYVRYRLIKEPWYKKIRFFM